MASCLLLSQLLLPLFKAAGGAAEGVWRDTALGHAMEGEELLSPNLQGCHLSACLDPGPSLSQHLLIQLFLLRTVLSWGRLAPVLNTVLSPSLFSTLRSSCW